MEEYKTALVKRIANQEALVAKDDSAFVGALIFSYDTSELAFMAVHPQYRKNGIAKALITKLMTLFPAGTKLSVTTYRDGDSQGIAARKLYKSMGFSCGTFVTVFNYPCQELFYIIP